ncbi:pentapeptide repeat-containing protein, partial [Microcoleus sp. HI-ES]|nr:pentapeptide repeat-containing protein [Microcoleus sp. HI-ES]
MTKIKLKILTAAIMLLPFCAALPLQAQNLSLVKRLLETRGCPGCDLFGASLSRADLFGASLSRATLSRADLVDADLTAADLMEANLNNANMRNAFLADADLSKA